jgi:hypothetical protein
MTTSFWDDLEIKKQFSGCATLQEIINHLETDFSMRGEVICEIRVNGVLLSESDETRFAGQPSTEIRDIAVRSNKPADLIVDAMNSVYVFVPGLETSCLKTAEMFRGVDLPAAQKSFHECLEGCQWMVDTLMHVRGAASGIQQPISQPERWFEAEKIIGRAIRELSEAYSNNDFTLVADLLEYELTGALAVWREALTVESEARKLAHPRIDEGVA